MAIDWLVNYSLGVTAGINTREGPPHEFDTSIWSKWFLPDIYCKHNNTHKLYSSLHTFLMNPCSPTRRSCLNDRLFPLQNVMEVWYWQIIVFYYHYHLGDNSYKIYFWQLLFLSLFHGTFSSMSSNQEKRIYCCIKVFIVVWIDFAPGCNVFFSPSILVCSGRFEEAEGIRDNQWNTSEGTQQIRKGQGRHWKASK